MKNALIINVNEYAVVTDNLSKFDYLIGTGISTNCALEN
jgi:hypothetical protein